MSNSFHLKSFWRARFGVALAGFILMTSCDPPNFIFEKDTTFSIEKPWTDGDSLIYKFEVKDTNRFYNLLLEIDHHKNYPFENLYVKIDTRYPNQKVLHDVVNINLADESGEWYSDCRGKTCTFYLPLQEQVIFSEKGSYQLILHPWMRQDTIKDIYRVAFKIEKDGKR